MLDTKDFYVVNFSAACKYLALASLNVASVD